MWASLREGHGAHGEEALLGIAIPGSARTPSDTGEGTLTDAPEHCHGMCWAPRICGGGGITPTIRGGETETRLRGMVVGSAMYLGPGAGGWL